METLEIPFAEIKHLLEMIAMHNKEIKMALAYGKTEASLIVRQSKHQKEKYLRELKTLLKTHDIDLSNVSD